MNIDDMKVVVERTGYTFPWPVGDNADIYNFFILHGP